MNLKKLYAVALLGILAVLNVACSGSGGPTPTRTPRAAAENGSATQTPWIIYVPVTTTPEPFTVTPLPTVTSAVPPTQPAPPTKTRAPVKPTTAPVALVKPAASPTTANPPTPAPPPATATPSCGQSYQVTTLIFPENGATRDAKAGSGAAHTIQFKWAPVASYALDPKLGYQVLVTAPKNSAVLYISHNGYLDAGQAILSQQATAGLAGGDDTAAKWQVSVVRAPGGFNDSNYTISGDPIYCGPASGQFTVNLRVIQ